MSEETILALLKRIEAEVRSKGQFHMIREGLFRCVLKAAFIKAYEFARYCHGINSDEADEGCFFVASALRGICEDLIALKFLRRLTKKDRDEVMTIKMLAGTTEASAKQAKFFKKRRPFQPVLQFAEDPTRYQLHKHRLTAIGQTSQLWKTEGKLPPIEQMATKVNLRYLYDFVYSVTSEVVHFSPRIALRSGWGILPSGAFSTKNFSRYYLSFGQTYGVYLLVVFCFSFRKELALSTAFMEHMKKIQELLDGEMRWPEAVTFEEMNQKDPGPILRAVLRVAHGEGQERKRKKRSLQRLKSEKQA